MILIIHRTTTQNGDPKSTRWRYLVCRFYYPWIRAVSFFPNGFEIDTSQTITIETS